MGDVKSYDCIRMEDVTSTFSAVLGNVQSFYENDIKKTRVLLRNVQSADNTLGFPKLWSTNAAMIKLAKSNINKKISFEATCERTIYKTGKLPDILTKWKGISNVRLI